MFSENVTTCLILEKPSSMANLSIRNGKHLNNFWDILKAADLRHYCDDVMSIVRVRGRFVDVCPDNVTYACDCASPWSFFLSVQNEHRRSAVHFLLGCTLPDRLFFILIFFLLCFSLPHFLVHRLPLQSVDNRIKFRLRWKVLRDARIGGCECKLHYVIQDEFQ